jgi:hypothetical protein
VLPYAVLVLLVAINAFLLAMLLWDRDFLTAQPAVQQRITPNPTPSATTPDSTTSSPTSSTATPSAAKTPSAKPTAAVNPKVVPARRLLVATTAREAWRATVGDCKTPGQVERSSNGGKSWKTVTRGGLIPIVRLGMDDRGNVYAVGGARPGCSTRYIAYSRSGKVAGQTDAPQGLWYLNPNQRDQVVGPRNAKALPCGRQHVVGLASLDVSRALVICSDGSAITTSNSGRSWRKAGELPGTIAVTAGEGRYWAAGTAKNCGGISVHPFIIDNGTLRRGQSRCATTAKIGAGQVAVGISGEAVWLWVGDKVKVWTDSGRNWG